MIVRAGGAALRRRAVVDDDVVGVELEPLARDVLMIHLALRALQRARLRAVAIERAVAVKLYTRLSRRDLDDMRLAGDLDLLLLQVAAHAVR